MGFTVVLIENEGLMDDLNDTQEYCGKEQVHICEEMGEDYQQQASVTLLIQIE